ncbi:MAG: AMP-binding protein [Bacteroidetes bacterium]|nr:AMP-binding protein [Bacteroidota bacterium]
MAQEDKLFNRLDTSHIQNIWEILENNVRHFPDNIIGFVKDDGAVHELSYRNLRDAALKLLGGLKKKGIRSGDKLILALNRNEETLPLLWACFAGNIIPTILQPPVSFSEMNPALEKIINVYKKLDEPFIVVSDETADKWELRSVPKSKIIKEGSVERIPSGIQTGPFIKTGLAFIQFSSGSTGDPKGIMLSHKNLLKNIDAISIRFDHIPADVMVNWMPLYHDMGLIGFHFTIMIQACNQYHIDPVDFIKNPFLWLDMLSQKKGTVTGCPNFGQALVIRHLKRKQPDQWDLSPVKVVFNGAEPISTGIMNEFMNKLAPYGFRKKAMMPVYGLAEATLAVSFSPLNDEPLITSFDRFQLQNLYHAEKVRENEKNAIELVSVGNAINHCEYIIADESNKPVSEAKVGHVLIRGENVTSGYYNDPESTAGIFAGPWLKTGDMGFIFKGNLYITGRYKDIIFAGGKNLYAHDLEAIACRMDDIPYGKIVIGGTFDEKKGQDQIIVFLVGTANSNTARIFIRLKQLMQETLALTLNVFVPVKSNEIPKTSSGKIQRYKLIERYLKGEFDEAIQKTRELIKENVKVQDDQNQH